MLGLSEIIDQFTIAVFVGVGMWRGMRMVTC